MMKKGGVEMEKEIFDTIHRRIKYIWEERIKEDYELDWLYRESTLIIVRR